MSDTEYIQALSHLRSEMKRRVLDLQSNGFPNHLIKAYWEVRYCFHWLYDGWWHFGGIDKEVIKLGSAKLVAEALVP